MKTDVADLEVHLKSLRKLRVAKILVSGGINIHTVDNQGRTALEVAEKYLSVDSWLRAFLAGLAEAAEQQPQPDIYD
uniref:Uncharacterized protein n=1 Tax=Chromera velia CCMP2878 TaxID=1169474 RepID=A0A0G4GDD0_9ALVE|eukprot:Cvel_630.t1-p1 / transcript=Cvel_630.t1 / gene=Cvel_630 / organism=Chromera_velia_CCMP2878 / gene_product=hypothetical protein / transcript_product=hypothetical protein / location=Cvel_scaffold19:129329-129556(-) / protein_length=76 / sequence_SO=supercontig / SO=protein_coding / is_pseudo=false